MKNMCSIDTNFDIIFVKEKEEVIKFQFRMKKLLLIIISIIKIFYFYVKWFHMMRGIELSVFPLEKDWKTYLSSKRFFVSGWFRVLKWFFMFLKAINYFNKIFIMFSKYFGLNIGSKWIFEWKTRTLFFQRSLYRYCF
jgi:hypothetical protein